MEGERSEVQVGLSSQSCLGKWKEASHLIAIKNFAADDCCSTRTTLPLPISRNCGAVAGWITTTNPRVVPSGIRDLDDSKMPSQLTFSLSTEISRESPLLTLTDTGTRTV